MLSTPDTFPIDLEPLKSVLSMPYTLTPGRAAGPSSWVRSTTVVS